MSHSKHDPTVTVAPPFPTDDEIDVLRYHVEREIADREWSLPAKRLRETLAIIDTAMTPVPRYSDGLAQLEARRVCGLEIEARRFAALPPCDRGAPRPEEPDLSSVTDPELRNRLIISYQHALERWYGA